MAKRKKDPDAGQAAPEYPIITRNNTPHWEDVFGKRTWVQASTYYDFGPKQGVTKTFLAGKSDPVENAKNLNAVLNRMGYQLKGHGSILSVPEPAEET